MTKIKFTESEVLNNKYDLDYLYDEENGLEDIVKPELKNANILDVDTMTDEQILNLSLKFEAIKNMYEETGLKSMIIKNFRNGNYVFKKYQ